MAKFDLREWAVKGAEQRLVELAEEARAIFAAFPELRAEGRGFDAKLALPTTSLRTSVKRRKSMSPATRKKIALAQKKRWAEWRVKQKNASIAKTTTVSASGRSSKRK
jgi:hypothetical protein